MSLIVLHRVLKGLRIWTDTQMNIKQKYRILKNHLCVIQCTCLWVDWFESSQMAMDAIHAHTRRIQRQPSLARTYLKLVTWCFTVLTCHHVWQVCILVWGLCYLSSLFPNCIQNDAMSQRLCLSIGFKKPRPILQARYFSLNRRGKSQMFFKSRG